MKTVKSLLCAVALFSLAALAGCGDDNDGGGTGSGSNGSGGGVIGLAPTNLVGRTMTVSVTRSDSPPFAMASTSYNLRFNTATDYTYNGNPGGTYVYQRSGDTATLLLNDFGLQDNLTATVTFSTATSGTIHTRNSIGSASEDGSFALTP